MHCREPAARTHGVGHRDLPGAAEEAPEPVPAQAQHAEGVVPPRGVHAVRSLGRNSSAACVCLVVSSQEHCRVNSAPAAAGVTRRRTTVSDSSRQAMKPTRTPLNTHAAILFRCVEGARLPVGGCQVA